MSFVPTDDCLFCNVFFANSSKRQWYDVPVCRTVDYITAPALGQIVPGYLLVVPRKHLYSMAHLTLGELVALREFCNKVSELQSKHWDRPVIFEHGSCQESETAGACITHAHWHLVPRNINLLPSDMPYSRVESFASFAQSGAKTKPYLYFEDQNHNAYVLEGKDVPSQLFRRELARLVGKPDEWDYLAFPFFENIRITYERLGQLNQW